MSRLENIYQQLCSPLASELLSTHPNDLASSGFHFPAGWKGWWEWATSIDDDEKTARFPRWMSLLQYYCSATPDGELTGCQLGDPSSNFFVGVIAEIGAWKHSYSVLDPTRVKNAHRCGYPPSIEERSRYYREHLGLVPMLTSLKLLNDFLSHGASCIYRE